MLRILALASSALVLATAAPAQILTLNPSKSSAPTGPAARGPSLDASRALALTFEDAVRRGARDECDALFDEAALLERASRGIPATEKVKKSFRDGAHAALHADSGTVGNALATVAGGGTLRWLDVRDVEGETVARFRLTRADASAPEYVELVLATRGGKSAVAVAVDTRSSTDAVASSRVLRRWLLALVADAGRSLPARIAGEDRAFALAGKTFETIDQAFEYGRNSDALEAWATLPESVRLDPSVVLSRLRAAFAAGGSTFEAALGEVRAAGRADASIELLAIDVAFATNRPERALEPLDALAKSGVVDPYLDALRGSILRELGRRDDARAACLRAVAADPKLEEAWWTLLGIAIEGERHEEAVSVIQRMDEHFEVDWQEFARSPAYAKFLASVPGSRWRAKLATVR